MFLAYQASMHWRIETGDFNILSENNRMIMSEVEGVIKGKTKLEDLLEIKARVKQLQQCRT